MTSKKLISREEILDGMSGRSTKQAGVVLALIENRTAYLLTQSRQAVARYVPPRTAAARSQAFLEALSQGRDLPVHPTSRDLEKYAPQLQAASGDIVNFKALQAIILHLPPTRVKELKLWLHQLTPEGDSEGLPARVTVRWGERQQEFDLTGRGADGQIVLPLSGEACQVEIKLS